MNAVLQSIPFTAEQTALMLAEEYGIPVFPCRPDKKPLTLHGFKDASCNIEQIVRWCEQWPDALVAVPTGPVSKLFVVDIDPRGLDWYRENESRLACGRIHKTKRGFHLVYKMPDALLGNSAGKIADGVDTRGAGGYIIWWPAHGQDVIGDMEDLSDVPAWVVQSLDKPATKPTADASPGSIAASSAIPAGKRNASLTSLAGKMRKAGADEAEILAGLGAFNMRCSEPLPENELQAIAASVARYEPGPKEPERKPFAFVSASDLLAIQTEPDYLIEGLLETGCSVGLVAPPESGKSLIVTNAAACVVTGRRFHGRRCKQGLAVLLWGEGQGGASRRLQALEQRYQYGLQGAPLLISKVATSLLDDLEVMRIGAAIAQAEIQHGPMRLLVVDTVSRFIAPGDESKAQDMGAFLAAVDRLRGEATSIICHHPGHADSTRGRGSSSWKAALDAEYSIGKEGDVITLTCQKMKDGEKPEPFSFRIESQSTGMAREDGSAVQSVVIVPTDFVVPKKPTGKNQKRLLAELENLTKDGPGTWTEGELRETARTLGMHKNSARDAVLGLRQLGYLIPTVGGSRLAFGPDEGTKARKQTGNEVSFGDSEGRKDPDISISGLSVPVLGQGIVKAHGEAMEGAE